MFIKNETNTAVKLIQQMEYIKANEVHIMYSIEWIVDAQMHGFMNGRMERWMDGWKDGRMDGRMEGWMNGRMEGWMNERMDDVHSYVFIDY